MSRKIGTKQPAFVFNAYTNETGDSGSKILIHDKQDPNFNNIPSHTNPGKYFGCLKTAYHYVTLEGRKGDGER